MHVDMRPWTYSYGNVTRVHDTHTCFESSTNMMKITAPYMKEKNINNLNKHLHPYYICLANCPYFPEGLLSPHLH